MEHYNKYYLVRASQFDNRRTRPPPTSYVEQRRHNIEHSYKDLLRELTNPSERGFGAAAEFRKRAQSALTEGAQDGRRQLLPRIPDKPPLPQPPQQRQPTSEERAESPAGAKAPGQSSRSMVRHTPKQQRAARNELCTLLSPVKTGKKGKKQKKKATEKPVVVTCALRRFTTRQIGPGRTGGFMGCGTMSRGIETSHQGQM